MCNDSRVEKEGVGAPKHGSEWRIRAAKQVFHGGNSAQEFILSFIKALSGSLILQDESHAGKIVDRKWYERNKPLVRIVALAMEKGKVKKIAKLSEVQAGLRCSKWPPFRAHVHPVCLGQACLPCEQMGDVFPGPGAK